MQALVDLVLAYLQDMVMQPGIARASYMNEQSESLAGILPCTHAAIFLNDTHGEEHTDEIGMHTVLNPLRRTPYRDAPAPPCPSHRDVRRQDGERRRGRRLRRTDTL